MAAKGKAAHQWTHDTRRCFRSGPCSRCVGADSRAGVRAGGGPWATSAFGCGLLWPREIRCCGCGVACKHGGTCFSEWGGERVVVFCRHVQDKRRLSVKLSAPKQITWFCNARPCLCLA